ncbi:DDE domain protein [uncultured archaeon]|nr:DDE domain protein [uncultured archaeon]
MLLYHAGLSYEKTGMFAGASYEAVREWYQKGEELFEALTKKKVRKWIAVDEKEISINGMKMFIWGAVDLDDEKVIAVWVSFGRSSLEAAAFLKRVRAACDGKLHRVFIDGGTWYPWALNKTGFKRYTVIAFGYRSAIERFFGDIEGRIRRFWNGFVGNYNRDSMQLWVKAFAGFRNYMKDPIEVIS